MKRLYEKEIKNKGIKLLLEGNNIILIRKSKRIFAEIHILFDQNYFKYIDHKTGESLNLQTVDDDQFIKCFKSVLGQKELNICLFNAHYILSGRKGDLNDLSNIIRQNWNNEVAIILSKANLLFPYDRLEPKLLPFSPIQACKISEMPDDEAIKAEYEDLINGYKILLGHIKYNSSFQFNIVENKMGVANKEIVWKLLNSLYWGRFLTGNKYSFEKIAKIYTEELPNDINRLPFTKLNCRFSTDSYSLEWDLRKKICDERAKESLISFKSFLSLKSEIQNYLLGYLIIGTMYNDSVPNINKLNVFNIKRDCLILYKKAILLKLLFQPNMLFGFENIRKILNYSHEDIYTKFLKEYNYSITDIICHQYVTGDTFLKKLRAQIDEIFADFERGCGLIEDLPLKLENLLICTYESHA